MTMLRFFSQIFERVSRSLLAELLVQSEASEESVFDLSPVGHALEESAFGASYGAESNATSLSPTHSAKSARHPRAQDDDAKSVSSRAASSEPPFLLLDVRPAEEFMECQIRGGTTELLRYKMSRVFIITTCLAFLRSCLP